MLFNKDAMPSIFAWSKTSPGRKLPRKRSLPSDGPVAKKAWVDSDICNANTSQEGTTEDTSQASFGGHDYCVKATTASTEEQLEAAQLRIKELEEINSRLSSEKCNLVMPLAAKPDQAMRFYTGFPSFKIDGNISAMGSEAHSRKDDKLVTDAECTRESSPQKMQTSCLTQRGIASLTCSTSFFCFCKSSELVHSIWSWLTNFNLPPQWAGTLSHGQTFCTSLWEVCLSGHQGEKYKKTCLPFSKISTLSVEESLMLQKIDFKPHPASWSTPNVIHLTRITQHWKGMFSLLPLVKCHMWVPCMQAQFQTKSWHDLPEPGAWARWPNSCW